MASSIVSGLFSSIFGSGTGLIGGGFNILSNAKQIIYHITEILTIWSSDKSIPIQQIINEYKVKIVNPIESLINSMDLALLGKSIELGIKTLNSHINKYNYSTLVEISPEQQIKILRGLGWKVSMSFYGPVLINWETWIDLIKKINGSLVNLSEKNPLIKELIQTYIININLSHGKLLAKIISIDK